MLQEGGLCPSTCLVQETSRCLGLALFGVPWWQEFAKLMFSHCKALQPLSGKYNELFEYFRSWVGTIPTAGCILLNASMTKLVLVKSWKGNSRGFPRGKINQGEAALAAAVREVSDALCLARRAFSDRKKAEEGCFRSGPGR